MHRPTARYAIMIALFLVVSALPAAAQQRPSEYTNPAVSDETDPAYWLDLGGLFATYGNYTAAVEAYQKALELDATMHQALFGLGLAYAEMDQSDQALDAINKAISLAPQSAHYYYGRARVLLVAGQTTKAREDFQKAADLGDEDAKAYLQQH